MSFDSNPDPGRTLGQFGLAVLALVVGAALLFLAIDRFSEDPVASPDPSPSGTTSSEPAGTAAPTAPPGTPQGSGTETATDTRSPSPGDTGGTETSDDTEATEDTTEGTEDPTEGTEDPTDEDTDDADRIDPSGISVQVLDAIKDGSDRAQEIADELGADGYDVVAFNPSSVVYDETTVFYTEGYEEEAQQVADENGWDELVFNDILSDDVDVHVVVGLDEQE